MIVKYLREFVVELEGLDRAVRRQIRRKLDELHRAPAGEVRHQPLRGVQFKGLFKLRVGDWRLIYRLDDDGVLFVTGWPRSGLHG